MEKWKQKLGLNATYNKLINVFECIGYQGYANIVRNIQSEFHTNACTCDVADPEEESDTHIMFSIVVSLPLDHAQFLDL